MVQHRSGVKSLTLMCTERLVHNLLGNLYNTELLGLDFYRDEAEVATVSGPFAEATTYVRQQVLLLLVHADQLDITHLFMLLDSQTQEFSFEAIKKYPYIENSDIKQNVDCVIDMLSKRCRHLSSLSLRHFGLDCSLCHVCTTLTFLRRLNIQGHDIDQNVLRAIGTNLQCIENLDMSFCNLSNSASMLQMVLPESYPGCPRLQRLNLMNVQGVSVGCVLALYSALPLIQVIHHVCNSNPSNYKRCREPA